MAPAPRANPSERDGARGRAPRGAGAISAGPACGNLGHHWRSDLAIHLGWWRAICTSPPRAA